MSTNLQNYGWQRPHVTEATVLTASVNLTYYGGVRGAAPGDFDTPLGAGFSNDGLRLIVSDGNNTRLQVFGVADGRNLTYLSSYGSLGSGNGNFAGPSGPGCVACHPTTSRVYVADFYNHRLHILQLAGDVLSNVGYYGSFGTGNGQFKNPFGVAVSRDGTRLAVGEYINYRVQIFGISGDTLTHQATFGGVQGYANGEFYGPFGVAFNGDGTRLAVAENGRVRWLRVDGNTVTNITDFTFIGGGAGRGVDISKDGRHMAVADNSSNSRVMLARIADDKFTRIAAIGSRYLATNTYGELNTPVAAVFHPDGVHMLIVDTGNHRIVTV